HHPDATGATSATSTTSAAGATGTTSAAGAAGTTSAAGAAGAAGTRWSLRAGLLGGSGRVVSVVGVVFAVGSVAVGEVAADVVAAVGEFACFRECGVTGFDHGAA
ncbi:hypothetical protein AAY23_10972, partial [Frankia casuarinae]